MEWVEVTGRTVEEALEAALDQLGIDERDAEVEVLEEPKTGLFGRIRTEARIRARVRPARPRPKVDRQERPRRRTGKAAGEQRAPAAKQTASKGQRQGDGATMDDMVVPLAEQADAGREFLDGLMGQLGLSASVALEELDEETVELRVEGSDLGFLIGPRGATLAALQDVTRTVVHRKTGGRNGRIMVDVAGYRQKRKSALERFTKEAATQVRETGTPRVLEPMSPPDRKVVHDTVNQIEGVTTTSEGEEPSRRVVINPT